MFDGVKKILKKNNTSEILLKKRYTFLLIFILFIAFILRILNINSPDGLWHDELYSWWIASESFPCGILKKLIFEEYNAPLYHFILHFWMKIFGNSDLVLKFLSVIFSTSCVYVAYLIGKQLKDKPTGIITALFFAIWSTNVLRATEVRFHILAELLTLISILFSLKILHKGKNIHFILFTLSNILLIYNLSSGFIFIGIESFILFIFLILYKKDLIKKFIIFELITFILCIPQLLLLLEQINRSKYALFGYVWEWTRNFNLRVLYISYLDYFIPIRYMAPRIFHPLILLCWIITIFIILLKGFFLKKTVDIQITKQNRFNFLYLFLIFILYTSTLLFLGFSEISPINFKYLNLSNTILLIIFAYCISQFKLITKILLILLILVLHLTALHKAYHNNMYKFNGFGMKPPFTYLHENNYDKGIIYSSMGDKLLGKYKGELNTLGLNYDDILIYQKYNTYNGKNMIFDDDIRNLTLKERIKYIKKYLKQKEPSKITTKVFNDKIERLKKGEYFIILSTSYLFTKNLLNSELAMDDINFENLPKSILIPQKVGNDYYDLAKADKRLQQVASPDLGTSWILYIFKKIK